MVQIKVHVSITEQHIKRGMRNVADGNWAANSCPTVLAVHAAVSKIKKNEVIVGSSHALLVMRNVRYGATLPAKARAFVRAFDLGNSVTPIEFDLEFKQE